VSEQINLDDLQYDWPPNVLVYDTKFMLGLNMYEMLAIAGAALFFFQFGVVVGLVGGALILLLVRQYEGLGNRRLHEYALAWLRFRLTRHSVTLPDILPAQEMEIVVRDLDGQEVIRLGNREEI
jgi:hypothetical protein